MSLPKLLEAARYYEIRWSPESYYAALRVQSREQADAIVAAVHELTPDLTEVSVHEIVVHDGATALCAVAFLEELAELTPEFDLADYAPLDTDDPYEWIEQLRAAVSEVPA